MKLSKFTKMTLASSLLAISMASHATPVMDTTITAKVKAKITMEKTLSVFNVGVETRDNVVHLQGVLDSQTQAATLVEIAESTDGVRDVDTKEISVKDSNQPLTDSFITAKVKGRFIQENLLGKVAVPLTNISVETNNGIVFLKGKVNAQREADHAIKIAKLVNGVTEVKSDIQVN
jgi:hyperosmotically inducible periplasmic protein